MSLIFFLDLFRSEGAAATALQRLGLALPVCGPAFGVASTTHRPLPSKETQSLGAGGTVRLNRGLIRIASPRRYIRTLRGGEGRPVTFAQHWYGERGVFQLWFVLTVATLWVVATTVLMISARRALTATRLALLGTTMLIAFALIRDISLHQIDTLIGARVIGVKIGSIVEVAGFALILLSMLGVGKARATWR
jgi:hypothetical protein